MNERDLRDYIRLGAVEWVDANRQSKPLSQLKTDHIENIVERFKHGTLKTGAQRQLDITNYLLLRKKWDRENRYPHSGKLKGSATGRLTKTAPVFGQAYGGTPRKMGDEEPQVAHADFKALEDRVLAWLGPSAQSLKYLRMLRDGDINTKTFAEFLASDLVQDRTVTVEPAPSKVAGELCFTVRVSFPRPPSLYGEPSRAISRAELEEDDESQLQQK